MSKWLLSLEKVCYNFRVFVLILLMVFCMHLSFSVCLPAACTWGSKDNLLEKSLSCHHVGPRAQTPAFISPGVCHHIGPFHDFIHFFIILHLFLHVGVRGFETHVEVRTTYRSPQRSARYSWLAQLDATQNHLPGGGTAYSRLGPPTSIVNAGNAPQACWQVKQMETILQLRFTLPRWPQFVSSWKTKQTSTNSNACSNSANHILLARIL